jgi:ribosomal protein L37AE/L43A
MTARLCKWILRHFEIIKENIMGITNDYVNQKQGKHARVCKNPDCGKSFVTRYSFQVYCCKPCANAGWQHNPESVRNMSDGMVRREERRLAIEQAIEEERLPKGYKPTRVIGHICHFYAPSFRCVCGKQQGQPAAIRARVVFVPAAQQAGD